MLKFDNFFCSKNRPTAVFFVFFISLFLPLRLDAQSKSALITVTDGIGRDVTLSNPAARVISLSPAATEILFAIGAGDRLIARTDFCTQPAEAAEIPSIGGFDGKTISIERILALQPDLVYISAGAHDYMLNALAEYGAAVFVSRPQTLDDILGEIKAAGALTGKTSEAARRVTDIENAFASLTIRLQSVEKERRVSVFCPIWLNPLLTVGSRSFINYLIEAAGGKNAFDDIAQNYPTVSPESVIARDPDVIILPSDLYDEDPQAFYKRGVWKNMRAVKNNRVFAIDGELLSRPGPRIADAAETIARALYPRLFEE